MCEEGLCLYFYIQIASLYVSYMQSFVTGLLAEKTFKDPKRNNDVVHEEDEDKCRLMGLNAFSVSNNEKEIGIFFRTSQQEMT